MRRGRPTLAALIAAVAALAACAGGPSGSGSAQAGSPSGRAAPAASSSTPSALKPTPSAGGSATGAATGSATGAATGSPRGTLTLAFGGDVHFATKLAPLLDDPKAALRELRPALAGADVAMVNLETAITTRGSEMPKQFHFRAPVTAFDALTAAGIDVVTMANNHAVDYGEIGLRDTLAARAATSLPVVGIGEDADDAYAPALLAAGGTTVAVLGATQVPDWTLATWPARPDRAGVAGAAAPERLATAVRAARAKADVVVVYLHWGTDYTTCPNALQQRTARALAEAGADVVVGTHAHRVQGAGWLGRTYVAYGLGNFVWWRRNGPADAVSGVLSLDVRGRRVTGARWTPMVIEDDGIPRPPDAATSARMQRDWAAARGCTGLAAGPSAG